MSSTSPAVVTDGYPARDSRRHALDELRRRVAGRLYTPEDPGWAAARTPWTVNVVQTPLAVLEVRDATDVQAAVRWAVEHDIQVTAQPGGHGANDALDGVLLLRTRALTGIDIDLKRRTVWVGAGVKSGELLAALDGTGLTFLAGSNPDTSVTGLSIGGGLSWFGRAYGLAANSIVTAEMVDGMGRVRRVSHDEDPDLFWAIRGGGGDFGIITRLELALHPAPAIYGGRLLWPLERMAEVLHAFRTVTQTAPPQLTVWYHTYRFPAAPHVPEPIRGNAFASVAVAYLGEAAEAEQLLAPLRAIPEVRFDLLGDVPLAALDSISAEPTQPAPGIDTSELLNGLDEQTIDRLVDVLGEGSGAPLAVFQIRHLGAAFAAAHADHGAAGHISQPYQLYALGIPVAPALAEAIRAWLPRVREAIATVSSGRTTSNFLNAAGDVDRCWTPEVRDRLVAVKATADPLYTIRSNRPVRRTYR